jgi:hypothetical protein
MPVDSSGHTYEEVPMGGIGTVRVTYVDPGWNKGPCIRIERVSDGKPNRGPEIPLADIAQVNSVIQKLIATVAGELGH